MTLDFPDMDPSEMLRLTKIGHDRLQHEKMQRELEAQNRELAKQTELLRQKTEEKLKKVSRKKKPDKKGVKSQKQRQDELYKVHRRLSDILDDLESGNEKLCSNACRVFCAEFVLGTFEFNDELYDELDYKELCTKAEKTHRRITNTTYVKQFLEKKENEALEQKREAEKEDALITDAIRMVPAIEKAILKILKRRKSFNGVLNRASLLTVRKLDLNRKEVTDLAPLAGLTALEELNLNGNPDLTYAQIAELQKALPKCNIISSPTLTIGGISEGHRGSDSESCQETHMRTHQGTVNLSALKELFL